MTQNQTTSLVKTPAAIAKWDATPEQVQLLKNTIAKGTSDDEFALFMTVAKHMELNPFLRQIHAVRRWDPEQERMVMQIQTGIDGYRLMAERSGVYGGQEGPWWCGEDGQWVDVWLAKVAPAAAKVIVHRTDKPRPFAAIALWTEYAQTKKDGTLTAMWRKRGPGQLAKCAEALAFRRAFPIEIGGGAHVDVEMDYIEAEAVEQPQFVAPPPLQGPPPGVPVSSADVPATKSTNVAPIEQPKRGPGRPPGSKNAERPTTPASSNPPSTSPAASSSPVSSASASTSAAAASASASEASGTSSSSSADPTSGAGSASSSTTETATSAPSATNSARSAADDGFGGEDPGDSGTDNFSTENNDPGLALIAEFQKFLATPFQNQAEMQARRPPFAQRAAALFKEGDQRFAAPGNGRPAGELAAKMGQLWAERKSQVPA